MSNQNIGENQNSHEKGSMFSNFRQISKCERCGKEFISQLELKLHKKVIHGEGVPLKNDNNFNQTDSSSQEDIKKQYPVKRTPREKKSNLTKREIKHVPAPIKKEDSDGGRNDQYQLMSNISSNIAEDLNKKIFLCGCSHKTFENTEDLTLHIKKQHSGFPPDGSMFGVCKKIVLKHFKPAQQAQSIPAFLYKNTVSKNSNFMCGCGQTYSCSTSLSLHIRKNHNGIQPEGTIKGSSHLSYQLSQQNNYDLNCSPCQQKCDTNYWVCDTCKEWKLCGKCQFGKTSKQWHEKEGHHIHMNH